MVEALNRVQVSTIGGRPALYFLLAMLALPTLARTQDYAIPWFSMDGGAGTSSGGSFSLSGTIGQPDAGRASGGSYTLTGGFWGGVFAVQTPGAPTLHINRSGNDVILSWDAAAEGYSLQSATDLKGTIVWTFLPAEPTVENGENKVTLPASNGRTFFRLKQPEL
jgi:hypothetical protein